MSSKLIVNSIENTTGTHTINLDSGNSSIVGDLTVGGGVYLGGSGSANLLDDYEEGTFTPTVIWGSGSPSYSASGRYTKVGNIVTIRAIIEVTSSGGTGIVSITNLPFTTYSIAQAGCGAERSTTGKGLVAWTTGSSTTAGIRFYDYTDAGSNGSYLVISLTYEVA